MNLCLFSLAITSITVNTVNTVRRWQVEPGPL